MLGDLSRAGEASEQVVARAYKMSGNLAKATATYEDFLSLWKDADPDVKAIQEAKAEYAKV